jgi:hypothetical protein
MRDLADESISDRHEAREFQRWKQTKDNGSDGIITNRSFFLGCPVENG